MELIDLGWHPFFESSFAEYKDSDALPGRVACQQRTNYEVITESGEFQAEVTGNYRYRAIDRGDYPSVGDWVVLEPLDHGRGMIHALLPRRTAFIRKAASSGGAKGGPGRPEQQVLAANIDTVLLVSGLDNDFNVRRTERYLSIAWDSGAEPVVVLNKADLCDTVDERILEIQTACPGVTVIATSATNGEGIEPLLCLAERGRTLALLGSSGVGKSSIINALLKEDRQAVGRVRHGDGRGRHTTTYRELIQLPSGGLVIDTPGIREIHAWDEQDGLGKTFSDIETLAASCRFGDCSHQGEPGCAVIAAIASGELTEKRYRSYLRLEREMAHLQQRQNERERRAIDKRRGKMYRRIQREHRRIKHRN